MKVPRVVLALFLISLVLRLGYGLAIYRAEGTSQFCDDWDYISYAKNILEQGIFVPDVSKMVTSSDVVGPVFPMIVAGTFAIFGENYLPIIVLNALVGALICILLYYMGKEIFSERVGILSAGWSCIYVPYLYRIPRVLKDEWLALLFPLVVYVFLLETKREKISVKSVLPIVLFAILIHMDERFFVFLPVLVVSFLLLDSVSWRNGLRKAVLFFAAGLVLMVPWTIRNYQVYHKPVILTLRTAPFTDRIFGITPDKPPQFVWKDAFADSILAGKKVPGLEEDWRYESIRLGLTHGRMPHKFRPVERWYVESKELWRPFRLSSGYVGQGFRFETPWSLQHNVSVGVTYGLLLPFFAIGAVLVIWRRHKKGIFIFSLLVVYTFIHSVLAHARDTYRVFADALIILIAFYALAQIGSRVLRRFAPAPKGKE
jgi:4-amino-4-deoxy-L-arabinose transferase-like glycosyltransferase